MRKSEIFLNSIVYAVYFLAACLCGVGVDFLVLKVLDSIIVVTPYLACILKAIIYFVVTTAVVFMFAFKEGYREANFIFGETCISLIFAVIIQFLFALLFAFNQFFAGGVKFFSALFVYGNEITDMTQIFDIRYRVFMPVFFALAILLCITVVLSKKLGCNSRLVSRKELCGSSNN